jgi:hypothetical protein
LGKLYHYPIIDELHGQRCYLCGIKTIDSDEKMKFLIIVSLSKPEQAMDYYK